MKPLEYLNAGAWREKKMTSETLFGSIININILLQILVPTDHGFDLKIAVGRKLSKMTA